MRINELEYHVSVALKSSEYQHGLNDYKKYFFKQEFDFFSDPLYFESLMERQWNYISTVSPPGAIKKSINNYKKHKQL